jgi:hypothetical protein
VERFRERKKKVFDDNGQWSQRINICYVFIKLQFYRFSRLDALEDSNSDTDSIWLQIKTDCNDEIEDKVGLLCE